MVNIGDISLKTAIRSIWSQVWTLNGVWQVVLPVALIGLALFLLNGGMYRYINPPEPFSAYTLPYEQTFDNVSLKRWFFKNGQWVSSDGALVQNAEQAGPAHLFIPHWLDPGQPYHLTVQFNMADPAQAAGITFNAQYPQIYTLHHQVFVNRQGNLPQLVAGYTDDSGLFVPQVTVPLSTTVQNYTLDLIVEENVYHVQLNDQTLIYKRPLFYHGGLIGLTTKGGPVRFEQLNLVGTDDVPVEVSPVEAQPTAGSEAQATRAGEAAPATIGPAATATPAPAAASPNAKPIAMNGQLPLDSGWVPLRGDWQVESDLISQNSTTGYDFAIAYTGGPVPGPYTLQVLLAHTQGQGGGVLFNMPSPHQLNGAHMVRYSDKAQAIFWGYYDDDGLFIGQGHAKLSAPGTAVHTFKVVSTQDSYDLYLDDQFVAGDIPLRQNSGYMGLITSHSAVNFSAITLSTPNNKPLTPLPANRGSSGDLLAQLRPAQNNWSADATSVRQTSPAPADYLLNSDVFASVYTVETTITLPTDLALNDAGGGFIFHMAERNQKSGAHMARLSNGGKTVLWGYYNADDKFMGQGKADVPDQPTDSAFEFRVVVRAEAFDLFVNGQPIAADILLKRQEGWLGLLAYRGPVTFQAMKIHLSESIR